MTLSVTLRTLNRHEKTFEATVRHVFPGGAYKVPRTIFPGSTKDFKELPKIWLFLYVTVTK